MSIQQPNDAIGNMLLQSISLLGIKYRWGGNTPQQGMDCSGFIRYLFQKSLGITLPRVSADMAKVGKSIAVANLQPGDLLFFNTKRGSNTHVGMYIGDNKFIQSPHTGADIQITDLNDYWRGKINGAKRIVQKTKNDKQNVLEEYQDVHDEPLPVRRKVTHKVTHKVTRQTVHDDPSHVISHHSKAKNVHNTKKKKINETSMVR